MTLTPTKQAMCSVIRESGIPACAGDMSWSITIDNHTLTQQEYEQWVKQNASKKRDD